MKYLLIFAVALTASLSVAKAQTADKPGVYNMLSDQTVHKAGLDTNVTTGTPVSTTQLLQIMGKPTVITIMTGVTKLTGTIGAGTSIKLYGGNNKNRWDLVTTATDTLAVADKAGEQVKTWKLTANNFLWYKVVLKGFGTQTSKVSTTALIK
ncbi:hypothetical protein ACFS5N_16275 [Mucilaginibacter ximonensis]|uniref:Uncharacterized protein n=1 Tax=Mucilaginibacter ximonensis TaxID=538021 RepID=A0ABW5YGM5_9SPHI